MNTCPTFIAHVEPAKSMKPGQRALHDPTRAAKTTAVRRPTLRELRRDPAPLQFVAGAFQEAISPAVARSVLLGVTLVTLSLALLIFSQKEFVPRDDAE